MSFCGHYLLLFGYCLLILNFWGQKIRPNVSSNKFPTCPSILSKIPCSITVMKNWVISANFVAAPLLMETFFEFNYWHMVLKKICHSTCACPGCLKFLWKIPVQTGSHALCHFALVFQNPSLFHNNFWQRPMSDILLLSLWLTFFQLIDAKHANCDEVHCNCPHLAFLHVFSLHKKHSQPLHCVAFCIQEQQRWTRN